jgi:hypothetical protein
MKLRTQFMLFAIFAIVGAVILWFLPHPITTISRAGSITTNRYWWWLVMAYSVTCGCAVEYFWMAGCDHVMKHMSRSQKIAAGIVLGLIIITATAYNLFVHYQQ